MENPFVNFAIVGLSLTISEFGLLLDKVIAHTICRIQYVVYYIYYEKKEVIY